MSPFSISICSTCLPCDFGFFLGTVSLLFYFKLDFLLSVSSCRVSILSYQTPWSRGQQWLRRKAWIPSPLPTYHSIPAKPLYFRVTTMFEMSCLVRDGVLDFWFWGCRCRVNTTWKLIAGEGREMGRLRTALWVWDITPRLADEEDECESTTVPDAVLSAWSWRENTTSTLRVRLNNRIFVPGNLRPKLITDFFTYG